MKRETLIGVLLAALITTGKSVDAQIVSASVTNDRGNILVVEVKQGVDIRDASGWFLTGGAAEILSIRPDDDTHTLQFELTDFVLPDDRFTLFYYSAIGNTAVGKERFPDVRDFAVTNSVRSYQGDLPILYVSPDGKAADEGVSPVRPTTFEIAKQKASRGGYILFRRGHTYHTGIAMADIAGEEDRPVILASYGPGPQPELSDAERIPVVLSACRYVQVVGFTIRPPEGKEGVLIDHGSRYCKLRSLRVLGRQERASMDDPDRSYGSASGIVYSRYAGDPSARSFKCEILHSYVDTFRNGIYGESPTACVIAFNRILNIREDGIRVIEGDAGFTRVAFNEVTAWSDDAIDVFTGSNVIIEYNLIHDPMLPLPNGANNGIKGGGVYQERLPNPTSYNNVYRYNTIFDIPARMNFTPAGITTNGCLSGEIYGNLCYNIDHNAIEITRSDRPSDTWMVYNNTAISNKFHGLFIAPDNPLVNVYNNIFRGGAADICFKEMPYGEIGGNILLSGRTAGMMASGDDRLRDLDDVFSDSSNSRFTLRQNSPAIDTGVSTRSYRADIVGNPIVGRPDAGCFEYQSISK